MKMFSSEIPDCFLIYPKIFPDRRGVFFTLGFKNHELFWEWKQTNCSVSHKNVIRGIHIVPFSKLVACVHGSIWDVVVDMREDSPTYLKWQAFELNAKYPVQVYVPPDCGHGFMSLEDNSIIVYSQTGIYNPSVETSVNWRDPKINITWPHADEYVLSDKDERTPWM